MASEKRYNVLEKYLNVTDSNTNIKIFGYGITSLGLGFLLYRIKPFAKYRKPSSIPLRFVNKKVQLKGTVKHIQSNCNVLLMIDHKPLIGLPLLHNAKYLPIKIAGLNVTANGINWLQAITYGKPITFIPLKTDKNYVACIVCMQDKQERINIGEELVKTGFAIVENDSIDTISKDKDVLHYLKCLLNAQKWAQCNRNGYWHFAKKSTFLWKLQQNLNRKLKLMLPKCIIRQFNI